MAHNSETGTIAHEINQPRHSASDWKKYLAKTEYETHPLAYAPGIVNIVGGLGSGKSTLVFNLLQELSTIIKEEHIGRVIYYSGSGQDAILEAYDRDKVEIFDRRSKESFASAIHDIMSGDEGGSSGGGETKGGSGGGETKDGGGGEKDGETKKTKKRELKPLHIVVVDDAITDADVLPQSIRSETPLSKLMMAARHVPCCIIITGQKYSGLPTFARANSSHTFVFKVKSPSEEKSIMNDINFSRAETKRALDSLSENSEFLWFQMHKRRITKNFTQSVVH